MARNSVMVRPLQNTLELQAISFVLIELMDLRYIFLTRELWDILLELKQKKNRIQAMTHLFLLQSSLQSYFLQVYLLWLCLQKFLHLILQWNLLRHPSKEHQFQMNLVDAGRFCQ